MRLHRNLNLRVLPHSIRTPDRASGVIAFKIIGAERSPPRDRTEDSIHSAFRENNRARGDIPDELRVARRQHELSVGDAAQRRARATRDSKDFHIAPRSLAPSVHTFRAFTGVGEVNDTILC